MENEQVSALEARVAALENDVDQLWKRLLLEKVEKIHEDLAALTASLRGTGLAPALQWATAADKTKWTAFLPDGRTAVVERLVDGDEEGNGAAFLPKVGDASGPVLNGLLGAMQWCAEFAAG